MAPNLFKEYVMIGGMPEVVRSFVETGDYSQTRAIFNRLQTAYMEDIGKYSKFKEANKYLEFVVEYDDLGRLIPRAAAHDSPG